jgi:hypothetical protein
MRRPSPDDFGEPSLQVAGFRLWIHGRQFPESDDFWDGNWLRVTAHCDAPSSSVWTEGAILMATDLERFGQQCRKLVNGEVPAACLDPLEPELSLSVTATDRAGHLTACVEITPDHLRQRHRVEFEMDQTYLPQIIGQCERIVNEYPIRGERPG